MEKKKSSKIGQIMKMIRQSKKLTLKETTGGEFSESQLARFEKGETELTVDKFFIILKRTNTYLDEYQHIYNSYLDTDEMFFQKRLTEAYSKKDNKTIKEIYNFWVKQEQNDPTNKYNTINKIVVKVVLAMSQKSKALEEDIVFLMDYLDRVEEWGRYEIWIFGNCLRYFDDSSLKYYGKYILGKTNFYHTIHLNQQMVIRTFLNIIDTWLRRGNLAQAYIYIQHTKDLHIKIDFFYEKIILKYHEGHYSYLQGNEKGRETMRKCAQHIEFYGYLQEAQLLYEEIENL